MPVVTDGGIGTGVEAYGSDFPFVNPSDDVKGLLADFYLSHAVSGAVLPLRLARAFGFCRAQSSCAAPPSSSSDGPHPTHDADVIVTDATGAVIFDSTEVGPFRSRAWGSRFRLFEWIGDAAVCRALVHTGDPDGARVFPSDLAPENGVLDERASEIVPRRLTSVTVNGNTSAGVIELVAGYNRELAVEPFRSGVRTGSRIVLGAEPGSGAGQFADCSEPDVLVRRVNGISPDQFGNLTLTAAGCHWLERPLTGFGATAVPSEAALRLHNDCAPCCDCADYENTYRGVRNVFNQFKAIGAGAEVTRGTFRANIDRWNAQRACRAANPTRLALMVSAGGHVGVSAAFCNADDDCKYDVDLELTVSHSGGQTASVVRGYSAATGSGGTVQQIEPYGSHPAFGHYWSALDPGRGVGLRTLFKLSGPVLPGHSVTVTATPRTGGAARPSASATAAMYPSGS